MKHDAPIHWTCPTCYEDDCDTPGHDDNIPVFQPLKAKDRFPTHEYDDPCVEIVTFGSAGSVWICFASADITGDVGEIHAKRLRWTSPAFRDPNISPTHVRLIAQATARARSETPPVR